MELKAGIEGFLIREVTADQTATAYGSGTVDVFATPAMVALMEQTAMQSVAHCLAENEVTVGTEIHVFHLRATPLGQKVSCKSVLLEIDNRKLTFQLEAADEKGVIGNGTHTRYIVDKLRFMNKL